ncbi:polar amino acid transport system substrate-binding protein [Pelomonas saccharophila]|uniref:Polar amino acid transport system substrate-binding protein n=1 Tax=Roseateles saccharophilus TaxID=304 RepID=A0ABU1YLH4_ROSSA|nr:ABC transporter substrate-binding protein [Roseateles saccharophilus]MDR7269060.1 polar amino acid transport system substrate-binding protein [Roseateles saccharophilus]
MSLFSRRLLTQALIATGLLAAQVSHADQLDDIKKKGELVVGVLGTDEPNSFIDPRTREIIGYEVDLARAIAARLGVKLQIKQLAVAARIPELQQGHVDLLAASLTHNKEREAVIDFSLTTFVTGQKVLVKADSGIQNLAALTGKKVVTIKGGTQEPNIRKAVPQVDVVTFDTGPQAFQALQQGKGVAFVNDEVSLLDQHAKLGAASSQYRILDQNISVEPLAIGIKKGEKRLKAEVDAALTGLEKGGEADKLFVKWYGPETRLKFPKRTFKIDSDKVES